jgi:hypothetical protein
MSCSSNIKFALLLLILLKTIVILLMQKKAGYCTIHDGLFAGEMCTLHYGLCHGRA